MRKKYQYFLVEKKGAISLAVINIFRSSYFQVVTVDMDDMSMDKFCFLIAQKKICSKLHKEKNDLVSSVSTVM